MSRRDPLLRGFLEAFSSCHMYPEPTQCSKAGHSSPQPGSLEAAVAHVGPSAQCPPPPDQGENTGASSKKEDGLEETNLALGCFSGLLEYFLKFELMPSFKNGNISHKNYLDFFSFFGKMEDMLIPGPYSRMASPGWG